MKTADIVTASDSNRSNQRVVDLGVTCASAISSDSISSKIVKYLSGTMAETLQQLILDTLNSSSEISDTRNLTLPGQSSPASSHDAQITILGALNSLLSREVCLIIVYLFRSLLNVSTDDKIHHA